MIFDKFLMKFMQTLYFFLCFSLLFVIFLALSYHSVDF